MMAELIGAIEVWSTFLIALIVFGLAPGVVLRLIVTMYPRNDSRRKEIVAELYAVPRTERPFWVVEQLEVAVFEGLPRRRKKRRLKAELAELAAEKQRFAAELMSIEERLKSVRDDIDDEMHGAGVYRDSGDLTSDLLWLQDEERRVVADLDRVNAEVVGRVGE
jgi:hypothetical protein